MPQNAPLVAADEIRERIDTSTPHSARFWNYFVGGKDNYEIDRQTGDQIKEIFPGLVDVARTSRQFLGRAVRYLAVEQGIRQFLDVGTGLPTADNTHQVAQRYAR
ncbi:SAM-dependent methyltransferase, partial [Streptomyces albidoflavus]